MPPKRKASTQMNKENHHYYGDRMDDEYDSDDYWTPEPSAPLVVFSRYSSDDDGDSETSEQFSARVERERAAEAAAKKASMAPEEFERWFVERERIRAAAIEELEARFRKDEKTRAAVSRRLESAVSKHKSAVSKSGSAASKPKLAASKPTSAVSKPMSGLSAASKLKPTAAKFMPAASNPKTMMMLEQLRALSRADLEAYCLQLQQQLSALSSSSAVSTGAATLGPEELAKRLSTLRGIIATQLEKSFKWTVACKRGTAIFNQSFVVPDAQLLALTGQPKMLKYKKYSAEDFQEYVVKRSLRGDIRYRTLYMTRNVIVKYDENEGILKITGKYGI